MKKITLLLFLLPLFLLFAACDKDDKPQKDSELKSFTKLEADKDTLAVGESTKIRAVYEGKGVIFAWNASSGNMNGGGDEITYTVAFCDIGDNTITCKATAEDNSITRTIKIHVVFR